MSAAPAFLTASWRDLVMLNFAVDPRVVAPLVPAGAELDGWDGQTLVSLVGFRFLGTRVLGVAVPGHVDFEEVNLRFFVRRKAEEGWRRGVVFVKEIVPRRAIAWAARAVYDEPYVAMPMRHDVEAPDGAAASRGRARYEWRLGGRWQGLSAAFGGPAAIPPEGSPEEFITEHYWGYTRRRDGGTSEYRVEHPRWRVWTATDPRFDGDASALYGPALAAHLTAAPVSAFVAEGSAVTVRRGVRV